LFWLLVVDDSVCVLPMKRAFIGARKAAVGWEAVRGFN